MGVLAIWGESKVLLDAIERLTPTDNVETVDGPDHPGKKDDPLESSK